MKNIRIAPPVFGPPDAHLRLKSPPQPAGVVLNVLKSDQLTELPMNFLPVGICVKQ